MWRATVASNLPGHHEKGDRDAWVLDRLARFMWEIGAFGELHATTTQETSEAKEILVICMSVDPESWVWFSAWACVESETMGHGRLRSLAGRETDPSCTPLVCMGYASRQHWPRVDQSHCDAGGAVKSRNSWAQTSDAHFQASGDCVQDQSAVWMECFDAHSRFICFACSHLGSVVVLLQALFLFEPTVP
ncbi:hypothetical protein BO82DRAFT_171048 [Aspergillus uvarum CBS 121591]|uniref:Uncharacterized protein n=1 Tax=Aspergillus uvarum CBS 121591 TaxID=1448315 RepID=A0A319C297_9EURO|nr:hypothetical protein BO82DRAFT_171048 [Aspergillus uvarum CBS 121591]PYH77909.1 hypothetical protein BO82DRAFT_171048 [Aspergillus uvarum CBS 121591]